MHHQHHTTVSLEKKHSPLFQIVRIYPQAWESMTLPFRCKFHFRFCLFVEALNFLLKGSLHYRPFSLEGWREQAILNAKHLRMKTDFLNLEKKKIKRKEENKLISSLWIQQAMTHAQETAGLCYRYESNREAPNSHKVLRPLVSDPLLIKGPIFPD